MNHFQNLAVFYQKNIDNDTIVIDGRKMAVGRGFICPVRSFAGAEKYL